MEVVGQVCKLDLHSYRSIALAQQSKDEWVTSVKEALKSWHQSAVLGQNRLARIHIVEQQRQKQAYPDDSLGAAKALRDVLRQAIRALGVPDQPPPSDDADARWFDPNWRVYTILTLRFIRGLSRAEIQYRIGLAEGGQYYTSQRKAIELLAALLREQEGDPEDEQPPITLEYPSGAVNLSDGFYIERQCDRDLRYEIAHSGRTITMTGARQAGKTSLLIRAVHTAVGQTAVGQTSVCSRNARLLYLDLQTVSRQSLATQDSFFQEMAYFIADELELSLDVVDKLWGGRLSPGRKLTKLLDRVVLPDCKRPLILALDEVDRLLLTPYHADFFGLLRSWHNMRSRSPRWQQFSLLMAISTEPYLLIDDMQQSPFNVGLMVYVEDFSEDEVRELNGRYRSPLPDADIPRLYRLLNGHPYLTRVAFYAMVKDGLTMDELLQTAVSDHSPFTPHLRYQRQLLSKSPALRAAMQQVLKNGRCDDETAQYRLLKAGLIRKEGTAVVSRCDLYREYFAQTL